jgi:putative IMPACT (imprinted ancient) family translation regulator
MTAEDTYKTIAEPSEGIYTEKRSKFIAIALPVRTLDEIKAHLETYQKKYYAPLTRRKLSCFSLLLL